MGIVGFPIAERFRMLGGTCRATWGSALSAHKYIQVSIHLVLVCRVRAARRGRGYGYYTRHAAFRTITHSPPPPCFSSCYHPQKPMKEGPLSSPSILSAERSPIKPLTMCLTRLRNEESCRSGQQNLCAIKDAINNASILSFLIFYFMQFARFLVI